MIIQIRGTSGSGKSTVVKEVMASLVPFQGRWEPFYEKGRKRPLFYYNDMDVCVLGHYEIDCGGCDTLGSAPDAYKLLRKLDGGTFNGRQRNFLCEGLLLSEDVKWTQQLQDVRCIFLTTDLEECLRRVESRQAGAGRVPADAARVRRKLETRIGTIERARLRLVDSGVRCVRCSSTQAPAIVLKWLGCTPTGKQ